MKPEILDKTENNPEFKRSWDFGAHYIFSMVLFFLFGCTNAYRIPRHTHVIIFYSIRIWFFDHQLKQLNFFMGPNKGLALWELFYFYNLGKANVID